MAVVITNAVLLDIDPLTVWAGGVRVEKGSITAAGPEVAAASGDEIVDAGGAVVMPGLVNGHGHLYSALAAGMPPARRAPRNFAEILEFIWWRLDRALDIESVQASAAVGGLDAIRSGTTCIIDHHSSPNAIDGSLDAVERGLAGVGVRGVLCYETTDRSGTAGRNAGLAENERYLKRCSQRRDGQFAGMVGAHAAFTLSDESLAACVELARRFFNVGVHIHVAEDPCDDTISRHEYGGGAFERLESAGVFALPSILAHGTHLGEAEIASILASPAMLAHNPRSNMNNAVGYAGAVIAGRKLPASAARSDRGILLGTDGIGSDMLAELQTAWLKSRDAHAALSPADCVGLLAASARRASDSLGVTLGRLTSGAAADVVITDYMPPTSLTAENAASHLLFALGSRHVRDVMIAGQWRMRGHRIMTVDEASVRQQAARQAKHTFERMADQA
jgi:putative selenium metabolism protein SsnA